MARNPNEAMLEEHIVHYLTFTNDYQFHPTAEYDREACLIKQDLIAFLQATQPIEYRSLVANAGSEERAHKSIYERIHAEMRMGGTLNLLRQKEFDAGYNCRFQLVYFQPNSGRSEAHQLLYNENRLSVVRQLRYGVRPENAEKEIDLVIFVNGFPVATIELKNKQTNQTHINAIKQYIRDRKPKGEPLLEFKRCLVHFAVGTEQVFMTTKLDGEKTRFFPFNKSFENRNEPGNPYRTSYLWEDILTRDSLLDLIQNYINVQEIEQKKYDLRTRQLKIEKSEVLIFPRFHQRRAVRKLLDDTYLRGVGHRYLIEHSAGSGKSNTIAWLAFRLASLHNGENRTNAVFDSVLVVTDRRVLDRQLQRNLRQFAPDLGELECIDSRKGMTSQNLKLAIEQGKKVIITTLQKFSVICDEIAHYPNRNYAIIIDEAHSSQTGDAARDMRKALSLTEAQDFDQRYLPSRETEDAVNLILEEDDKRDNIDAINSRVSLELKRKTARRNISFYAFTATPKSKTIEIFCEHENGQKTPFDVYSMEDAINEGFIRDVLENYTSFRRYYKLVRDTRIDDKEYDKKKAIRLLSNYVDIQEAAIERKSRIMVEHFATQTATQIEGQARAMLVTRSRLHAVRYKRMFDKIMQEMHLPYGCLVAFSGSVYDSDTDMDYTEASMNQLEGNIDIPDAFKMPQYRILIVADKYQTGFDEPMLHTMFVDKCLGGTASVQTLSRLNRTMAGKTSTMVLDFVNDPEDIQEDFQKYYGTNFILEEDETNPNSLYDLKTKVFSYNAFTQDDVDAFAAIYFSDTNPNEIYPILYRICDYVKQEFDTNLGAQFRKQCNQFVKLYKFLCQVISFEDISLEKLYVFLAALVKQLPFDPESLPYEVLQEAQLDSYKVQYMYTKNLQLQSQDTAMEGLRPGAVNGKSELEMEWLSKIIKTLNETFGLDLTPEDRVDLQHLHDRLSNDSELMNFFNSQNARDDVQEHFNEAVDEALLDFINGKLELYNKLSEDKVNSLFKSTWFNDLYDRHVRRL